MARVMAPGKACKMTVRPARASDAAGLARLCAQLGYPSTANEVVRRLARILPRQDHLLVVAESADGMLAGMLHAYICEVVESDRTAELGGLVVDESARGRGTGRLLLERAEAWARENGCATVTLRSNVMRNAAHSFYQHLGYGIAKTQYAFRKNLADE